MTMNATADTLATTVSEIKLTLAQMNVRLDTIAEMQRDAARALEDIADDVTAIRLPARP